MKHVVAAKIIATAMRAATTVTVMIWVSVRGRAENETITHQQHFRLQCSLDSSISLESTRVHQSLFEFTRVN